MKLAYSQLCKMHVYTASGVHVGKVSDVIFDVDTGILLEYAVKTGFRSSVTIAREQVVRIENDRLIVEDRVFDKDSAAAVAPPILAPNTSIQVTQDETP